MSRFDGYEDDSEWANLHYGRWLVNMRRVLRSKRGVAALREMEAALLALPGKRLIEGALCKDGEVCAIGAGIVHRRVKRNGTWFGAELARFEQQREAYDWDDALDTAEAGRDELGMTYTLAYVIGEANDDEWASGHWPMRHDTPEERYQRVLAFVQNAIRTADQAEAKAR